MRYLLCMFLPALALAQVPPSMPSGRALLTLPSSQFQAYVSGIYEGQALLATSRECLDAGEVEALCWANLVAYRDCLDAGGSDAACRGEAP